MFPSVVRWDFCFRYMTGILFSLSCFRRILSFVTTHHPFFCATLEITSSYSSLGSLSTSTLRHFEASFKAIVACFFSFWELLCWIPCSSLRVEESTIGSKLRFRTFASSSKMSRLNWDGMKKMLESKMTLSFLLDNGYFQTYKRK